MAAGNFYFTISVININLIRPPVNSNLAISLNIIISTWPSVNTILEISIISIFPIWPPVISILQSL